MQGWKRAEHSNHKKKTNFSSEAPVLALGCQAVITVSPSARRGWNRTASLQNNLSDELSGYRKKTFLNDVQFLSNVAQFSQSWLVTRTH